MNLAGRVIRFWVSVWVLGFRDGADRVVSVFGGMSQRAGAAAGDEVSWSEVVEWFDSNGQRRHRSRSGVSQVWSCRIWVVEVDDLHCWDGRM